MKIHLREKRGEERALCHKLPTFYDMPRLTNSKSHVTCQRCKVVLESKMRAHQRQLVGGAR